MPDNEIDDDIDIRSIDLSEYQSAPMLPVDGLVQLMNDLDRAKPANAPAFVVKSAAAMMKTAGAIETRLAQRIDGAASDTRADVDFDIETDRSWGDGKVELERRMRDKSPALNQLSEEDRQRIDLDHLREMADVAEELHKHLFGLDGTRFLRLPFAQQVVQMVRRLSFIHNSPRAALYKEALGEGLLDRLDVLQVRYAQMVHSRAVRAEVNSIKELRHDAQRNIALYASAVLMTMDADDKSTVKVAMTALRPIRNARNGRGARTTAAGAAGKTAKVEAALETEPEKS